MMGGIICSVRLEGVSTVAKAKGLKNKGKPSQRTARAEQGVAPLYKPEIGKAYGILKANLMIDAECAEVFGVSVSALQQWKTSHQTMVAGMRAGKAHQVELLRSAVWLRAVGTVIPEEKVLSHKGYETDRVITMKTVLPDTKAATWLLERIAPEEFAPKKFEKAASKVIDLSPVEFDEFIERAKYPKAYPAQLDMAEFAFGEEFKDPRMILGSRGYGKTDYVTIMRAAYSVYLDTFTDSKEDSILIITKSDKRNQAIVREIFKACSLNGVEFDQANASTLRIRGHRGKDASVETLPLGATSFRGRHPKRIVMDDPVTEDDTSAAARKRAKDVYDEVYKLCKNIVLIGQPVHIADLYQELRGLVKKKEYPWGTIPELDTDLDAAKLAGVSAKSIEASYHLRILSEGDMPFEKVKVLDAWPEGDSVAFLDPSFTGGDYSGLTIMRGHFDGVAIMGKAWKRAWNHIAEDETENGLLAVLLKYGVKRLGVECNSLGDMPLVLLRKVLSPHGIGVIGKISNGSKHSRIMAAGVYAEKIHMCAQSDPEYKKHVVGYEYDVEYDDAPDSLASCLEMCGLIRGKQTDTGK